MTLEAPEHQAASVGSAAKLWAVAAQALPDALLVLSRDGRVLDCNQAACALFECDKPSLLAHPFSDLVPNLITRDLLDLIDSPTGNAVFRVDGPKTEKGPLPLEVTLSRLCQEGSGPILARLRPVASLEEGDGLAGRLLAGMRAVLAIADELMGCDVPDLLMRRAVELARERLGLERCAIFIRDGDMMRGTYGTDAEGRTTDEHQHHWPIDAEWEKELRLRTPKEPKWSVRHEALTFWDGQQCQQIGTGWVVRTPIQTTSKTIALFFNDAGLTGASLDPVKQDIVAVYCSLLANIIERKRVEENLRASEERFRSIFETAEDSIFIKDRQLRYTHVNPTMERLFQMKASELVGRTDEELFGPETAKRMAEADQRVLNGEIVEQEHTKRVNGMDLTLHVIKVPLRNEHGEVVGLCGFARDITSRKRLEQELRESRDTAWALLNATSELAMLLDAEGVIIAVNEAMARSLGKSVSQLLGTKFTDHLPAEVVLERAPRVEHVIRHGEPVRFTDQREGRHFVNSLYPVFGPEGRVIRVAVFAQDITDQKRAEEAQRLATVGQLAAGVAHEFNNLLAGMMMMAEQAELRQTQEDYRKLARLVLRATARGADICRNLNAFARPGAMHREPIYVETAIEAALAMVNHRIVSAGVSVVRDHHTAGRQVLADPGQLEQVLLNLFINACHAMPSGGTLTVKTRYIPSEIGPGEILISVSDTGVGIAPEHLPRIFEPFFTTKGQLGGSDIPGTGLGLSVSHGIILAHGGSITAYSTPGMGATFEVRLPVYQGQGIAVAAERQEGNRESHWQGLRVLLAEDEGDLRELIANSLAADGHEVLCVGSATAAVKELEESEFDLVITDLMMPGGGGWQVLARLSALERNTPTIVITGRIEDSVAAELEMAGASRVLQKPFSLSDLNQVVTDVLNKNGGPALTRPSAPEW